VRGLFDTKIAARFTGARAFGLASLLEEELGLKLAKNYQRADWAKRPLPDEMLEYAAMDTRYLPELRDLLKARLEEQGRLAWAEEEFLIAEQTGWDPPDNEDEAYLRLKNTRDLAPRSRAAGWTTGRPVRGRCAGRRRPGGRSNSCGQQANKGLYGHENIVCTLELTLQSFTFT
jgi:hypothetical protein